MANLTIIEKIHVKENYSKIYGKKANFSFIVKKYAVLPTDMLTVKYSKFV